MSTPVKLREIRIHAPDYQSAASCEQIASYLRSLPGVRAENEIFVVQEKDNGVSAIVFPAYADAAANGDLRSNSESAGKCNCIVLRVEPTTDRQTWNFLAAFVFGLARWTGWQVYESDLTVPFPNEWALVRQETGWQRPAPRSGSWWWLGDLLTEETLGACLDASCCAMTGCWFAFAVFLLGTLAVHVIFH